jgi:hypothetical protein
MNTRLSLKIFLIPLLLAVCLKISATGTDEPEIIRAWQLRDLYTEKQSVVIDTMINSFHIHNPLFRQGISYSYLGNAGLAAMSNFFSEQGSYTDFFFIDPFMFYLNRSTETRYYNTRRPFSLLDFSSGGPREKNEKMLNILHTQNVNPDFNLGFRYFNINSDGQYQNQQAVTNAISLFSSYVIDNYQLHVSINLNSARVFENGGLQDDASLRNTDFETEDHAVRLQNARNQVRNNGIFISQSWHPFMYADNDTVVRSFPSWLKSFRVYHVLQYDRFNRTYQDNNPLSGFYPEVLINNAQTSDSVFYRSLTNKLMVDLPGFSRGIVSFNAKGGLKNEMIKGDYNILNDTTFIYSGPPPREFLFAEHADTLVRKRSDHQFGSTAMIAFARGGIGEVFSIWGEGSLFFQGRRAGDYNLQAGISFDFFEGKNQSVIEASIRQSESTPSVFLNSFSSNHFEWQNDFRRTGFSTLKGAIKMPERNFDVFAEFSLVNNYIYFDSTANPRQFTDVFPLFSVSLKKGFNLWKFYFRNVINYQVPGKDDILPLPALSVYHSAWFEQSLIRDILNMQIGFDIYYSTSYGGYAYQPAISRFHLQDERMLGNYPFLDVFINFKHKRTRVFLKGEHLNSGVLDPEYFTVLHYPRNQQMFKFGVSWSFYN